MAKKCFQGQWVLAFALTAATLLVSSAGAIAQEVDRGNAGSTKIVGIKASTVRRGLKPIQYYYLAETAAIKNDLRTVLACCQNLQQYTPKSEARAYLTAVLDTLAPKYPVDRACLELYEKTVLAEGSKSEKQALRDALIKKYPKFEYGYLLGITENPFEDNTETNNFIYQQVQNINPNNAIMLAALCAKAYQNYDEEECKCLYLRLRKLNPYFKTFALHSLDSAYEQSQLRTSPKLANVNGSTKSPFAKPKPKLIPLYTSGFKQIAKDRISTDVSSVGPDVKGNPPPEEVKKNYTRAENSVSGQSTTDYSLY